MHKESADKIWGVVALTLQETDRTLKHYYENDDRLSDENKTALALAYNNLTTVVLETHLEMVREYSVEPPKKEFTVKQIIACARGQADYYERRGWSETAKAFREFASIAENPVRA
jgi:hypothetical protein